MDDITKSDIESSFNRVEKILRCGIFSPENMEHPLVQSALTELLIRVRDLMEKAKIYAGAVDFTDDVNITDRVKNVSEAIAFVRNAICHIDSENHYYEECNARISYTFAYGQVNLISIGDVQIRSKYEDDVCFFFGSQKLYLKRHIVRAYEEAKKKLIPIMNKV
ncbi:MAG: hypothetical protein AAB356_01705 [Deltaproteobacteria bacterium]